VLGIAQTGTGKTAAFTLPMLSLLEKGRARARMPRTLILEPTRELAAQVEEAFGKYGVNHRLNLALLIGGVSFGDQETRITRGADVLIATPGRLLDFVDRGKLLLTGIEILVIDEADRMLDMGFIPDIERICKLVPFTRQTLFFSATMPPEITRLVDTFLHNPVRIEVARAASTATGITQTLVRSGSSPEEKRATLRKIIRSAENFKNAIIFCNRKRDVAVVYRSLEKHGFSVGALHGDLDQRSRMAALDAFRNDQVQLLVCSDVAARGLDIPDVSHVINYDAPHHAEDYVHRIGRTGRAGKLGAALTIVSRADQRAVDDIEKLIERKIDWQVDSQEPGKEPVVERYEEGHRGRQRSGRPTEPRRQRTDRPSRLSTVDAGQDFGDQGPRQHDRHRSASLRKKPVREEHDTCQDPRGRQPVLAGEAARQRKDFIAPSRSHRSYEDVEAPIVGMGDHIPGFLLRPVKLPPLREEVEE
jgi:superfamily II DNA/RNA helicase